MGNAATLNSYDVLMLPCQGAAYAKPGPELQNIIAFANAGGRIYSSHFSYVWMNANPPWDGVANWAVNQATLQNLSATVDQTFSEGVTLAQWLQVVGATTVPGQIPMLTTTKHDQNGVIAPNQSWLTLNDPAHNNPVMQFVFDAPVGQVGGQCGRVLFNEYHVEAPPNNSSPKGVAFPMECSPGAMSAQEKLLEYSLFELTSDGTAADLEPKTRDFGTEAIGFNSAVQTFTWKNNSTFSAAVNLIKATGDFAVVGQNCLSVASGASCTIQVVYNPSVVGPGTGTLTVGSSGTTLIATLSGTGIPDLSFSLAGLNFGSIDVGAVRTQSVTVTNSAIGAVPVPSIAVTGDFFVASTCGQSLAAGASCTLNVSFKPTVFGMRTGTMVVGTGNATVGVTPTVLTGNGLDFTLGLTPASGNVIAGYTVTTESLTTPEAGFGAPVTLSCTTTAPATTCAPLSNSITPSGAAVDVRVSITTGAKYTVIGYGGAGGGWLWALAVASGGLLFFMRRRVARFVLVLVLLGLGAVAVTGCSGKTPGLEPVYTAPGTYTFTVSATDGFLVHSTTYALTVTAK